MCAQSPIESFDSMRTVSAGTSDVGKKRPHNEDAYIIDDAIGLYVVADGVGGHAKGEIASRESVDMIVMWVRDHLIEIDEGLARRDKDSLARIRRIMESGVQSACYMVFAMADQDPEKKGMSTTMSVLLVRNGHAFVAQVGDSRVYRLRREGLTQMTEDHTLINYKLKHGLITPAEARAAGGKNVITRAVGHKDYVQVDTFDEDAEPDDRYLLCTDGLHGYLDNDDEIIELMRVNPLEQAAQQAIDFANDRGGKDNITAVMIEVAP
jgi:serine/threonine protein phosphatase PrpC